MTALDIVNVVIAAFILSAVAVRLSIPSLARRGFVATENERTMHKGLVPKGGGIALIVSVVLIAIMFKFAGGLPLTLISGLLITLAVSAWDDRRAVPPSIRIIAHFSAAGLAVAALPQAALVLQGFLPLGLDRALSILILAALMNFFNFMDGINGIAGSEMIAICLGYAGVGLLTFGLGPTEGLAIAIAAACGGFLIWNARVRPLVFLGDSGSVTLGYLAGVLMIDLAVRGYWAAALILPSYFFADALITLGKRALRRERVWEAHRTHFYQRAAAGLGSHLYVVIAVALANVLLIALTMVSLDAPLMAFLLAVLVVLSLLIWMRRAAQRGRSV